MSYRRDFTIGPREVQAFSRTLALGRWWRAGAAFGLTGALVCWVCLPRLVPGMGPGLLLALAASAGLAVSSAALGTALLTDRARARRRFFAARGGSYLQRVDISGLGVQVAVDQVRAGLRFDRLMKIRETRRAFYLFLSPEQAWILPKAQMEDPAGECRRLREIFTAALDDSRLRLKKS